ncbi:hypothetical protein LZ32DRAFT_361505 [Colletotrichum eremochloae]|nr:hypothetical protein LZ32DRAFT_361505 [Colletotrichum eremochloae]
MVVHSKRACPVDGIAMLRDDARYVFPNARSQLDRYLQVYVPREIIVFLFLFYIYFRGPKGSRLVVDWVRASILHNPHRSSEPKHTR